MGNTFTYVIELIGTVAFAISGIRLAVYKRFDWFGAYVIGFVTAIGGGTLRDLLLGAPVFWMQTPMYLAATGVALAAVIVHTQAFSARFSLIVPLLMLYGLALFVIIGISKTLDMGHPMVGGYRNGWRNGCFRWRGARHTYQRRTALFSAKRFMLQPVWRAA